LGQCLILSYPLAVITVSYAFCVGRGRRWAWAAYGLLVFPILLMYLADGGREVAACILIILGFVALLGYFDFRRANRPVKPKDSGGEPSSDAKRDDE
jgi:hypothetical protein